MRSRLQRLIGHSCGRLTHEKLLDLQSSTVPVAAGEIAMLIPAEESVSADNADRQADRLRPLLTGFDFLHQRK
jgi:hypothetical protein